MSRVGQWTGTTKKYLQVFVEDTDLWRGEPLHEAILRMLQKRGVAGATVCTGVLGYGVSRQFHRSGLFGDQKPVIVTAIDSEATIRAVLPELLEMVEEGLVAIVDAEVFVKSPKSPRVDTSQ